MLGSIFAFALSTLQLPSFAPCELDSTYNDLKGSECVYAELPLNYQEQSNNISTADTNATLKIFVRKFPALEKAKGTLWLLAGGPGESGAAFYSEITWFKKLFPEFDIYVQDHRGTGASSKICPQENIDSEQGLNLAPNEWGPCYGFIHQNSDYVKSFSISNAAEDLANLIKLYGKGETYVYGVSYGTQLALRLLSQEKVAVNGVILDSLVPHQLDDQFDLSHRSHVVNYVGQQVLARLSDKPKELENTILTLNRKYLLLSDIDKSLPNTSLSQFLGTLLDIEPIRSQIPTIVTELNAGNVEPIKAAITDAQTWLKSLYRGYTNEGMSLMLVDLITSSENNLRPQKTKKEVLNEQDSLAFTSPLPYLIAESHIPTYAKDKYFGYVPNSNVPILVLQGTLDPKTQFEGAKAHLELFEGNVKPKLVALDGAPHAIIYSAQKDAAGKEINAFVQQIRNTKEPK